MSEEPGTPEDPIPGQKPGPTPSGGKEQPRKPESGDQERARHEPAAKGSRTGALWAATTVSIVLLILLIIFILQNQGPARIVFFGLEGSIPLGMALLIAAVAGAVVVAIAGVARLTQVRIKERRARRQRK
ncbi:lipopolysaccharide assembly protein LapA domain-containing protein [Arthrobacter castelli]|uniref:lipopolysaccharide assembly protein LapA domain-containing protein n=1 Tax=Arthrobacter castelli TaxID=271431 RepID=UPI0009D79745|nr:lipopolysaccharide assembly protein LapA domain-containing protein [Arthrobacter castelli]